MTKRDEVQPSKETDKFVMGWIAGVSNLENEAWQEMKMASWEKCELLPGIKRNNRDAIVGENFVVKVARVDELNSRNEGSFAAAPQNTAPAAPNLMKQEDQSVPKRRRRKRNWSSKEEAALKNGIEKFGAGFWKEILSSRRDEFNERTEVDLKDKWRNMSKHVPR
ncbi:Single myb histone 2 [Linum perenne]